MWNPNSFDDTDYGLDPDERFEPDDMGGDHPTVSLDEPHIMTLLGPIQPSELGICLTHVHLLSNPPGADLDHQLTDPEMAETEVEAFVTMNGRSLVEATTPDMGRMIPELLGVAGWVPAHIISVTGRQSQRYSAAMPNALDLDSLTEEFIADLTIGMDGTEARAGVIKVGTSLNEIADVERVAMHAAANAHNRTGASITTHTENGTMALELIEALGVNGVEPNRVIIGHLDRVQMQMDTLLEVAESGAYLQYDQIGKDGDFTDQMRADQIMQLCEAGFTDQLLLGLDYARRSQLIGYDGAPGLPHLSEWFMVMLMEAGLDAMTIRSIVIDNPARALTIHPPQSA